MNTILIQQLFIMLIVTTALVEIVKKSNLAPNFLPFVSVGMGILVTFAYRGTYEPSAIMLGTLVGLGASGGFEAVKRLFQIIQGDFGIRIPGIPNLETKTEPTEPIKNYE